MSSTSQVTTFSDLYTDLLGRVRAATGVTATDTQAKRYINIALQDMHLGFDYRLPWAERSGTLRTQDDYSTGTVTVARGSTTVTGVGSAWNTNNDFSVKNVRANGKIVLNGSMTPYRVSSVASDTSLTLTTAFTEASVSTGSYVYFEDEYDLAADFLRPVDAQRFSHPASIDIISRNQARLMYPSSTHVGKPKWASIVDFAPSGNTTPIRRVRLFPPPNDYASIPYAYITSQLAISAVGVGAANLSADTDEPIVPLRYRHALVWHALQHWYRDKKDDTRSVEAKAEYTDIMTRISLDNEVGGQRPQLRPMVGSYRRAAVNPYTGSRRSRRGPLNDLGE